MQCVRVQAYDSTVSRNSDLNEEHTNEASYISQYSTYSSGSGSTVIRPRGEFRTCATAVEGSKSLVSGNKNSMLVQTFIPELC